jgi:hypothetical protein
VNALNPPKFIFSMTTQIFDGEIDWVVLFPQ